MRRQGNAPTARLRVLLASALVALGGCATKTPATLSPLDHLILRTVPLARAPQDALVILESPEPSAREAVLLELAQSGRLAPELERPVVARLEDPERKVREAAAWALARLSLSAGGRPDPKLLYDTPPRQTRLAPPRYPQDASIHKIEGVVELLVLIDETGRVGRVGITRSIPALDEAAMACVSQWEFEPARRQERPVPTAANAPVQFRID